MEPKHNAGPAGRIYLDEWTRGRNQAAAKPADALAMRLGYLMRAFVQGQLTTAEYTQRSSELLDEWDVLDRRDDANPNSDCEPVEFDGLAVADLDGEVA